MVSAFVKWAHRNTLGEETAAVLWLLSPQNIVNPDNVAFMGGFVVDGDGGSGLDPQVASSPLEPAVVTRHYLAFPQY